MSTTTQPHLQQLTEHIRDWRTEQVIIDRAQRLVRNIALTGLESKNGYRYSEEALRQAIPLYENKPVFLDHAQSPARPYDRSTRDLVGSIVNPRFENGRVRGDIRTLDTEAGRTFLALAETDTPAVGMSHVVLAERSPDKSVVETIHDVVSVDAVAFPATSSTFRESVDPPGGSPLPGSLEALLREVDARLPDHLGRLAGSPLSDARLSDARRVGLLPHRLLVAVPSEDDAPPEYYALNWDLESGRVAFGQTLVPVDPAAVADGSWAARHRSFRDLLTENRAASPKSGEQLTLFPSEDPQTDRSRSDTETQREINRLLAEARLPNYAVTDGFRRQLRDAPDRESRRALIAERQALLKQLTVRHPPTSRERRHSGDSPFSDESIIAAVRRPRRSALCGLD